MAHKLYTRAQMESLVADMLTSLRVSGFEGEEHSEGFYCPIIDAMECVADEIRFLPEYVDPASCPNNWKRCPCSYHEDMRADAAEDADRRREEMEA